MAHFAELDSNNIVIRCCVVDNAHVPEDMHVDGETWCTNFWGGNWKQYSYNNNFRKQGAGPNMTYDPVRNEFVSVKPYPSWKLDSSNDWQAPTAKPDDDKMYFWDEDSLAWVEVE
tara:strand:+ start:41 stop:385 length:345 start_codon:yes stop_codon:yes gene_type:complete